MEIKYKVTHLKPIGQYKDRQEIGINGIPTMFMNGEFQYLQELKEENYRRTKQWCIDELLPYMTRKSFNPKHNSYSLKHIAEREIGDKYEGDASRGYVCNAEIKYILSELGHKHDPSKHYEINYHYKLSQDFYKNKH